MNWPNLCAHHTAVYATRLARLRHHVNHHSGKGRKALTREAATIAQQCRSCLGGVGP